MKKKTKKKSTKKLRGADPHPCLSTTEMMDLKELVSSDGYKSLQKIFDHALQVNAMQLIEDDPQEDRESVYKKKLKIAGGRELVVGLFGYLNGIRLAVIGKEA